MHAIEPKLEYAPGPHGEEFTPVGQADPEPHVLHELPLIYDPGKHFMQLSGDMEPDGEYMPVGHGVLLVEPGTT